MELESNSSRQSNFELLRIYCMWGVLTNHVLQNLWNLHTPTFTFTNEFRILLMSMSVIAVNCFVLISGYFRIKPSLKGFLKLYMQCVFYFSLLSVGAVCIGLQPVQDALICIIFPLTEGGLWFIVAYFGLFLLAPLLNAGYDNLKDNAKKYMLLVMIVIDVYIGYMHQSIEVTVNGYHLIHFIVLYYVALYLREYAYVLIKIKLGGVICLIVLTMVILHAIKMVFFPISIIFSFRYNSPVVLLASVCVFLWFASIRVQNTYINWISASVLSVYIVHSHPFGSHYFFGMLKQIQQQYTSLEVVVLIPVCMAVLYVSCIAIDKLRIRLCAPIEQRLLQMIQQKNHFDSKV